ncbi:MAG TPA: acetyl-CoA carboxylase biotin carboxyl carrier protein, partial [Thermomicrobiales bacterium]|nr:acetyl-CoA carboxylase biotin carboxyl carrier protein [Thermomicrobiales bacterium]
RVASGGATIAPAEAPAAVASPPNAEFAFDVITAPMVGSYYAAPSPGSPPFIEIGDAIEPGQPIGIIEAMKIMNEIVADRGGVVDAILVENGQAVEYGSPLVRLRPVS